jgi:hypothetical protein
VQFYDLIISATDEVLGAVGGPESTVGERVTEMRDFFAFVRDRIPGLLDEWEASRRAQSGR